MPKTDDHLVRVTVKFDPKFYEGQKHRTHKEIAAVLEEQAKRFGAMGGLFLLLAAYHHRLEAEPVGTEPEGDSDSFTVLSRCGGYLPLQKVGRAIGFP